MTARLKSRVWLILAGVGIAFLLIGILRGETQIIFTKAVNICLECIGIG